MKLTLIGTVAALAVMSASAFAGTQTWDFNTHVNGNDFGNTIDLVDGSVSLQVSAWSSTSSGCIGGYGNQAGDPDPCIKSGKIVQHRNSNNYYGVGIINRDEQGNSQTSSPNHAIDNFKNGGNENDLDYEMLLLSFDTAVNITHIDFGWTQCSRNHGNCNSSSTGNTNHDFDADASLLAFTGNGNADISNHRQWGEILNEGWSVINHYAGGKDNNNPGTTVDDYATLNTGTSVFSKYWLIGAYNDAFDHTGWTNANDAFKLLGLKTASVSGPDDSSNPVNAPASLGILMLTAGMLIYRRKKS